MAPPSKKPPVWRSEGPILSPKPANKLQLLQAQIADVLAHLTALEDG
jgi:hypothetical protein